jgi:3-oxoacyl-[acyl-carrier-protein] synthase-3
MAGLGWPADTIDAVLFVSQTPDYRLPATACAIHGRLGLKNGCLAFDINLGCSGYPYGLFVAAQLASSGAARRVLLLVGDTITKFIDPRDRTTAMLFGDAASATLVEASDDAPQMTFVLGTDGTGADHLIIPSGGARSLWISKDVGDSEDPALPPGRKYLFMNGAEVFAFSLRVVPRMIAQSLDLAGWPAESVDLVVLHQANAFMLNHLIKRLRLPAEKVPISLDGFGNTSSASIPVALSTVVQGMVAFPRKVVLAGFGVGFSWGAATLELEPGVVTPLLEVPSEGGGE